MPTVPVRVLSRSTNKHKVFLRNSGFNELNVLDNISAKAWTNNNNAHNVSMHMD